MDLLCATCLSIVKLFIIYVIGRSLGSIILLGIDYSNDNYWLFLIMQSLPTLLFFTSFSLFIYFFAKIVTEEESDSTNLLKPFFFVFNAFTYLAFFAIAIYSINLLK